MRRAHWQLAGYGAGVVAFTFVHASQWLALGLAGLLLLAGRQAPALLRRSLRVILLFNLTVSLGYLLVTQPQISSAWETLLRLNLRVLLLTLLSFLFIRRVNPFQALDFSPTLLWLLGLTYSQAMSFGRTYADFRHALTSRTIVRPRLRDRYRAGAAAAAWFMDKACAAARETAQAMRARGFFDD